MQNAGGLIGWGASKPLIFTMGAPLAVPMLVLLTVFGLLVVTATPVNAIPQRLRRLGVRLGIVAPNETPRRTAGRRRGGLGADASDDAEQWRGPLPARSQADAPARPGRRTTRRTPPRRRRSPGGAGPGAAPVPRRRWSRRDGRRRRGRGRGRRARRRGAARRAAVPAGRRPHPGDRRRAGGRGAHRAGAARPGEDRRRPAAEEAAAGTRGRGGRGRRARPDQGRRRTPSAPLPPRAEQLQLRRRHHLRAALARPAGARRPRQDPQRRQRRGRRLADRTSSRSSRSTRRSPASPAARRSPATRSSSARP